MLPATAPELLCPYLNGSHQPRPSSDVVVSPAVKAIQAKRALAHALLPRWRRKVRWHAATIAGSRAGFLAESPPRSISPHSQRRAKRCAPPKLRGQHRGGPPGFAYACSTSARWACRLWAGNRQAITTGNLAGERQQGLISSWTSAATAREKSQPAARGGALRATPRSWRRLLPSPRAGQARPEQVIVFEVEAWDNELPQHIPRCSSRRWGGPDGPAVPGSNREPGGRGCRPQGRGGYCGRSHTEDSG
jgi:hypothetical protein